MRRTRLLLSAALLTAGLAAVPARAAAPVYEVSWVPGPDGSTLRVEVLRDPTKTQQPVILTLSPYNLLNGDTPADSTASRRYVSQGYAVAVADVLGTRGSSGCWDYGGKKEQAAGVAVVKWLAHQKWANGRVGMTGVSYDGTTANMVAATGIPELKAVVPVAAISHWYGYAYFDGVRYSGNSEVPTDEGIDTPLGFDYGFARARLVDPKDPSLLQHPVDVASDCGSAEHTRQAYSRTPDYTDFWKERDYVLQASRFRAAVFLVHGWQDYNVKQDEALRLYDAIPVAGRGKPGVPYKRLWLTQSSHADGSGPGYTEALDRFWAATLKSTSYPDPTIPAVTSRGADGVWRTAAAWPVPGTRPSTYWLGRTSAGGVLSPTPRKDGAGWTYVDSATATEEATLRGAGADGTSSLVQVGPALRTPARLAGSAVLDAWVKTSTEGQHLTPLLVDVAPDGSRTLVERGFLNLSYRNGPAKAEPTTGWQHARVTLLPQDYTFAAGHRVGLVLQSSNTVWGLPGAAGTVEWAMGPLAGVTQTGTRLVLPVVGALR